MRIEPQKILCAIDFSEFSNGILAYGSMLAAEFGSKLYLCHIVPGTMHASGHLTTYFDYFGIESEMMEKAEKRLRKVSAKLDVESDIIVASGHPATQIEYIAHEQEMDMVLAATHGRSGMKRFLMGSVTERLVKVLNCPLLVLQGGPELAPAEPVQIQKILVGCDFSSDSGLAFDYALSLAQEFQTQLHLAHVVRTEELVRHYFPSEAGEYGAMAETWDRLVYPGIDSEEKTVHERLKDRLMQLVPQESSHWCTPVTVLLEGQPYQELVAYAEQEQVDLIVLGIRGHNLLEEFLVGSTADRVLRRSPCPVLAVRHKVA